MRETPIWRRYLRLLGSDPAADVEDELGFHFDMRVEDLVRRGMPEALARARAKEEFGDVDGVRDELREIGRRRLLREKRVRGWESFTQDLRLAVRTLRRSPGFTAVASFTLALGIGASTAMFSVLDGVLLSDLPVRDQEELVVFWKASPGASDHLPVTYHELADFREVTTTFQGVAGVAYQGSLEQVLVDGGRPVPIRATWVTGDFFSVLGVVPVVGRTLLPSDDVPGAEPVIVISHGLWVRHFGSDPGAVGHTLDWSDKRFRVVGVLPPGFEYPKGAEVWIPVLPEFPGTLEAEASASSIMVFDLVGRLRAGAGIQEAREELHAFLRQGDSQRSPELREMRPVVTTLSNLVVGDARARLWIAAGAVGLLLLIACVNVANLLLIRGTARTEELAIRSALGAGKRRLVRQLLTESGVLALAAGLIGILMAFAMVRGLVVLAPPDLPRREMIGVDGGALLFALSVTCVAALVSGLLPAVLAAKGELGGWPHGGARTASGGRSAQLLRQALVVGQVSLAIIVVVGAGLLMRSLVALQNVEMGFDDEHLVVVQTDFSASPPERARQIAIQEEMVDRVRAIPGVAYAATLPRLPFSGQGGWSAMFTAEGQDPALEATNPWVNFEVVGHGYFETLRMPLLAGRAFNEQDREDAPPVAIVTQSVARHAWSGMSAVGRRIKLGPADGPGEWLTVVGVVGEARFRDLTEPWPSIYLPIGQFAGPVPMSLAVRTLGDPGAVIPQVRRALEEAHPELMLVGGGPMRQLLAAPLARPRFSALLLGAFAMITLLLAAVGLYAVMAATVRQRTRELGIRLALGATAQGVQRRVLGEGVRLALLGSAIGVAGALIGARLLESLIFGVDTRDPATFASVVVLILVTAALACYIPARRASRVDPVTSLKAE